MMEEKNITRSENGRDPELMEYEMTELYLNMQEQLSQNTEVPEELEIPDIRTETVLEGSQAEPAKTDISVPALHLPKEAMSIPETAPTVPAIPDSVSADTAFSAVTPEMPKTQLPQSAAAQVTFQAPQTDGPKKPAIPEIPSFAAVSLRVPDTAPAVPAVPTANAVDVTLTAAASQPAAIRIPDAKQTLPELSAVQAALPKSAVPDAVPAVLPEFDGTGAPFVQIIMPESKLPDLGVLTAQQADIPAASGIPSAEIPDIPAFNTVKAVPPEFPETPPLPDFEAEIGAFMESVRATR